MTTGINKELQTKWQIEHGKWLLLGREFKLEMDGTEFKYDCQVVWNAQENVIHYAIFGNIIDSRVFAVADEIPNEIDYIKQSFQVHSSNAFITRNESSLADAVFSRKVFLVCHSIIDQERIKSQLALCKYQTEINDDVYYTELISARDFDVFISHDSRDKETLVRQLHYELSIRLMKVWLDENNLTIGDRLTTKINDGLCKAKFCMVVLSPHFLANLGWCDREFRSIVSREVNEKRDILMPIWHNVSKSEVLGYSLELVDRVALNSSIGVSSIAEKIKNKVYANP